MNDPKPAKRYRASKKEWKEMRAIFKGKPCSVCGGTWDSLHHILPRSKGGDDVAVNLAPVCGSGTTGCHGRLEDRDPMARAKLRASLTGPNYAYLHYRLGETWEAWLDRRYPSAFICKDPEAEWIGEMASA
jgi:5-methylcytosine-specific restriction endonuclease McrA